MAQIEIESKFELPPEGFEKLKASGIVERCEEQLNVYYDAEWRLANSSATCRVRYNGGSYPVMTLKVPVSQQGANRVMREYEVVTTGCPSRIDVDKELPAEWANVLHPLGVDRLNRVGSVRNTRFVVVVKSIGALELDRLELPDGSVVHEVEIETDDRSVQRQLTAFVFENVPDAKPSVVSKFQRFRHAAMSELP
jgi:uncharacterized protein YjbK